MEPQNFVRESVALLIETRLCFFYLILQSIFHGLVISRRPSPHIFHVIHTALDELPIPFSCEYFIIPYLLWFGYVGSAGASVILLFKRPFRIFPAVRNAVLPE